MIPGRIAQLDQAAADAAFRLSLHDGDAEIAAEQVAHDAAVDARCAEGLCEEIGCDNDPKTCQHMLDPFNEWVTL